MTRARRLHAIATTLMALFSVIALISAVAFITVRWTAETGRFVKVALVGSIVGFISTACIAMLAAAAADARSGIGAEERREE